MVTQVALSLVLMVMAGLLARTMQNLLAIDVGFNRNQLLLFSLEGVPAGYAEGPRLAAFYKDAAERVRAIPGVRGVTFSDTPVLSSHGTNRTSLQLSGDAATETRTEVGWNRVAAGFFATYEMSLLLGREFTARDDAAATKVVVINQALAEKYFPRENPIGQRIRVGRRGLSEMEIVGVVRDFRQQNLRRPTPPTVYTAVAQNPVREAHFAVRTSGLPEAFFATIRKAVADLDPNMPVANLRTLAVQIDWTLAEERIFARIATFFGLAALALACVGLYGLMSYGVLRRTSEIGLRIALGALPRQVLAMILRESFRLVLLGVLIGLGGALASARLMTNLLFGLTPADPVTYFAAAAILVAVATVAALLPARRAAKVDPMVALRAE
jgi:predicted permease